jgi:hypothetical protein
MSEWTSHLNLDYREVETFKLSNHIEIQEKIKFINKCIEINLKIKERQRKITIGHLPKLLYCGILEGRGKIRSMQTTKRDYCQSKYTVTTISHTFRCNDTCQFQRAFEFRKSIKFPGDVVINNRVLFTIKIMRFTYVVEHELLELSVIYTKEINPFFQNTLI